MKFPSYTSHTHTHTHGAALCRSRGSGAYIFFPAGPAVDTEFSSRPAVRLVRGPLVAEVTVLQPWIQHRVALHNTTGVLAHAIEIKNMVRTQTWTEDP